MDREPLLYLVAVPRHRRRLLQHECVDEWRTRVALSFSPPHALASEARGDLSNDRRQVTRHRIFDLAADVFAERSVVHRLRMASFISSYPRGDVDACTK